MSEQDRRSDDEHTRRIAREAACEAVRETLKSLGIDVDQPIEAQRDAALLRTLRKAKDRGMVAFITAVGGIIVLSAWEWVVEAAKSAMRAIGLGDG